MKDLLTNYSVDEILIFVVFLALAFKAVVSFWDWGIARLKKIFGKESEEERRKMDIDNKINEIYNMQKAQSQDIEQMKSTIDLLTDSDRDNIKAWITERHHYFCYEIKAIDYFSLDTIKRRYKHYKLENGNSFIDTLMRELEALPKIESEMILRTQTNYDNDLIKRSK